MTTFYWVRHGPTHAKSMVGWSDLPADLSDTARLSRLSSFLPDEALILSSDLRRASETADAIAGSRERLPDSSDLRELNFGAWELCTLDTVAEPEHLTEFWDYPGDVRAPGGESWNELRNRVDAAVLDLVALYPRRAIIAVAHMGAILTQIQRAQGLRAKDVFSYEIGNLSVTELHLRDDTWQTGKINHHP